MCKMTLNKRIKKVPSLEELQRDIYKETLEHMVNRLMKKKNIQFPTARDFDAYHSDDDEVIISNCIDEIIDKITEN